MGRKHGGKRRKCWLAAFSPFPSMFSKDFLLRVVKTKDYVVKGLLCTTQYRVLTTLDKMAFENIVGKGKNAGNQRFLLFPQCFLSH